MVMKDKLEKFGHKRGYYAARATFVGFIASLCVFSMVAIPTYIVAHSGGNMAQAQAEENSDTSEADLESVNDNK